MAKKKAKKGKKATYQRDAKSAEEYRKMRYDKAPQWMKEKPNDISIPKTVDGKEYHWCPHHRLYQMHE